jgi:hypothetical protein
MPLTIGRRKLIAAFGSVAAWPLVARAQQVTMPLIGFLGFGSFDTFPLYLAAFRNARLGWNQNSPFPEDGSSENQGPKVPISPGRFHAAPFPTFAVAPADCPMSFSD